MKGQRWEEELEARCKDWANLEESHLLAMRSDPALISTDCSRHCSLSSVPSPSLCVVCESGLVGFVMTRGKGTRHSQAGGDEMPKAGAVCLFLLLPLPFPPALQVGVVTGSSDCGPHSANCPTSV